MGTTHHWMADASEPLNQPDTSTTSGSSESDNTIYNIAGLCIAGSYMLFVIISIVMMICYMLKGVAHNFNSYISGV